MPFSLPPFYPITDLSLSKKATHLEIVKELIGGGAKLIQIRDKELSSGELLSQVLDSVRYAKRRDVKIIVNDRVDIAMASGADGVHLGQEDLSVEDARKLLGPKKIIGFSTHSYRQAIQANRCSANYIAIGPIFKTSTKGGSDLPLGPGIISRLRPHLSKPIVAVGGITIDRVGEVLAAGANAVAVISDVLRHHSIRSRAQTFLLECSKVKIRN